MSIWLEAVCIVCPTGAGLAIAVPAPRLRIVATVGKNFDSVRFPFFGRRQGAGLMRRKVVCLSRRTYAAMQHSKMDHLHVQMRMVHGRGADLAPVL
jgi:hypothetical protein